MTAVVCLVQGNAYAWRGRTQQWMRGAIGRSRYHAAMSCRPFPPASARRALAFALGTALPSLLGVVAAQDPPSLPPPQSPQPQPQPQPQPEPQLQAQVPSQPPPRPQQDAPQPQWRGRTLAEWRDLIAPKPEELAWQQIPWRASFWSALHEARAQQKPILLWAMNGHPLGCT